jgi:predicted O-methyltransferase YrrM
MREALRAAAEAARGFMPPEEGAALYRAAASLPDEVAGALVEVGSYCGKSSLYLGAAAQERDRTLFCIDHHRGSEEMQAGWTWHEPDLVDPHCGRIDSLPWFRRTVFDAGLEPWVIAVVGDSTAVAAAFGPVAFVFIDGGHGADPARADYAAWAPKVVPGGLLAIHDVFPDPADGGRPPHEDIYLPALRSGWFEEKAAVGSLRVLQRG